MNQRPEDVTEFNVAYAGVISDVSFVSIDPSGRSDLLKIIDQAQSSGSIALLQCLEPDSHRISIARHHVRVWTIATQRVELRVPLHIIASVGYIQDDGIHIICINIGPDPRNRQIRDLVILVAANKAVSEEVCSVLSSRFQAVYREAVVGLTDAKTFKGSFPQSASNSHGRGRGSVPLDSAETKTSLYTTSDSNNDAVSEYLALASASLNELEFREYAELLHRSKYGELPLRELAHKLMELFGPRRKHLLTRLHLLIRDEDQAEFREFLELHNITDSEEGTHQYSL
ncbi:unnamed protein product [Cylicocyclus nassatus]|uniref:Cerebral cavernous malformations 2 harmonin-homology domain-containing protein n=1 Tax=Cylicocyclus nassatus TaxID=53992 RepID=A0AA36MA99_CYLNA|nr:unnamed protein product [Cylicocyclus nassatus]